MRDERVEAGQHEVAVADEAERADAEPRDDRRAATMRPTGTSAVAVEEKRQCRGRRGTVLLSLLSFWYRAGWRSAGCGSRLSKKTAVLGIIERSGRVVCKAVPNVGAREIMDFASAAIRHDTVDIIYTDQLSSYRIFNGIWDHKAINHKLCYIDGDIHTNGAEGLWSLLKRGINGVFHHVSAKHLPCYLDEFMWRFNNRENGEIFGRLLGNCAAGSVKYAELVA